MSAKDFYHGEDGNQGAGAIHSRRFSCVFYFVQPFFSPLLKQRQRTFLYLCNLILEPEPAVVLTVDRR